MSDATTPTPDRVTELRRLEEAAVDRALQAQEAFVKRMGLTEFAAHEVAMKEMLARVRDTERELCAQVCESRSASLHRQTNPTRHGEAGEAQKCASAIRSRRDD
jgi:hypothetical protein